MGSVLKSGDAYAEGLIGKLLLGKIEGAGTVGEVFNAANETGAGVVRGVLGLGWDLVSGVEHLGNSAVQFSLSQTTEELSLDAAILGENIRLGNVCAEGLLQDVKQTLNAAKKAAADEWDKASHASLGDQAEMATRIAGIIGTLFIGVGESEIVGAVSKASEVARVDEVNETVNTLNVIDASKVDSDGVIVKKAYSNPKNRPRYAKGQVEQVWGNASGPDGRVYDPNTGEELIWDVSEKRKWDMGHLPGQEYRMLHKRYIDGELTTEEFLIEYRDPAKYRPESQSSNRSHKYEKK
ncbi:HNH/ENDO VII family nuclease [Rahnella sp. SAP-29]|nr:HNH/ENDO VII family nuclease [Rahnella laticis]